MNKKIVLSVVLVVSLLLSMLTMVSAEGDFKINARVSEWTEENTFDLYISLENNPGVAAIGYSIEFDGMLIRPLKVEKLELLDAGNTFSNVDKYIEDVPECLNISHFDTVNFEGDGDIQKVTFEISPYASSANSGQNVEIKLVENPLGLFYNETWSELIPVYGETSVVLPVIEGDGETFVPNTDKDDESEEDNGDGGMSADEYEEIINSITKPSEDKNLPTVNKYDTTIILTINSVEIKVNDNTLINDVAPIIVNDRTMLPIRVVAEELGADVEWDEAAQKVTVVKDDKKIVVYIDSAIAYVDDNTVQLDSPAFIQNDRTYLPLRFISENLGASVDWDEDLQQVTIKK